MKHNNPIIPILAFFILLHVTWWLAEYEQTALFHLEITFVAAAGTYLALTILLKWIYEECLIGYQKLRKYGSKALTVSMLSLLVISYLLYIGSTEIANLLNCCRSLFQKVISL